MSDGSGSRSGASLVLSCEHAGNVVPPRWAGLFGSPAGRAALHSHRGWDPGSEELGAALAARLAAPIVVQRVTRLLVECNRSIGHPRLWSEFSRGLPKEEKAHLLEDVWGAHRDAVRTAIADRPPGLVVHVGVHTFTSVWNGRPRSTDIGLLYDPARPTEARLAAAWTRALKRHPGAAGLTVHRNRPYRGWTDGLTTALRAELPAERYVGIELELSQARVPARRTLANALADTLAAALSATE